jgi:hypothetical protein
MASSEQERTISALKITIQMEIEGKSFYLKSAETSSNKAGKQFFIQLEEEKTLIEKPLRAFMRNSGTSIPGLM